MIEQKILDTLNRYIKTCQDCGKQFLGLALRTAKECGNYRIDSIEVNDYPLRCNKCPECSMNCFEKAYNKAKENDDSPIDIECEKDFYTDENPDCYDVFFDDFDESHMWVERDYQDRTDLIDLFEELKSIDDKKK